MYVTQLIHGLGMLRHVSDTSRNSHGVGVYTRTIRYGRTCGLAKIQICGSGIEKSPCKSQSLWGNLADKHNPSKRSYH